MPFTEPWVWVCKNNPEIVYDVLVMQFEPKTRRVLKTVLKGTVCACNAFFTLKGFVSA